jgi:hypothetical protein
MLKSIRRTGAEARVNLSQKRAWFVDVTVTTTNVRFSSDVKPVSMQSGETITIMMPVYLKAADGLVYKFDGNLSAEAGLLFGWAMQTVVAANQWLQIALSDPSCTPGFTMTPGVIYVPSATAGGIAPSADVVAGWYLNVGIVPISTTKGKLMVVTSGIAT